VYSTYSTQLADRLGLTATESSILGTSGQMGMSLSGVFAGMLIDRCRPTIPILLGAIFILAGYSTIYHSFVVSAKNMALLVPAYILAGCGNTLVFNASVRTAAMNFPNRRGTVIAVPMSAFGLSAFFSQVWLESCFQATQRAF